MGRRGRKGRKFLAEAEYADEGELLQALVEMGEETLLFPEAETGAGTEPEAGVGRGVKA